MKNIVNAATTLLTAGVITIGATGTALAVDMGNMMNPSQWFGGNNQDNYYDDRGYGPGPGYGPPPGQGYPPPGQGGYPPPGQEYPQQGQAYTPQGQAYPPQGQGYTPQGYGYGAPLPAAQTAPAGQASVDELAARISELEERVRRLESTQRTTYPPQPATPVFAPKQ